ncbi:MAG: Hsp20/alpha crystallin family protein [Acidobacteria bacterium]|nr:Hsp20/alpha crystallin family protein [Acidobacteriota bacterium]MCB9399690.1 Hsp20/alpha crystallin family protein [Acidobacteriota bacterium]
MLKKWMKKQPETTTSSSFWPVWHPFHGVDRMLNPWNGNLFSEFEQLWGRDAFPRLDLVENDTQFEITAELPGMDPDKVSLDLSEGQLHIAGQFEENKESKRGATSIQERRYGRFDRSIPLPDSADLDAAKANFKNGLLTITIPKKPERIERSRKIPVQVH